MLWLSDDIPVRQWEGLRGGPEKGTDEEIAYCSSALDDLPSSNERISRKAEQNSGEQAQGILLEIDDRLGQISATKGRHTALNTQQQGSVLL